MQALAPSRRVWLGWGALSRLVSFCLALCLVLFGALVLGACASTRVVDSEVRSFGGSVAPLARATFRFDRLPSQQSTPGQKPDFQDQLEAIATSALAEVGLTPDAQQPQYLAQVSASVEQIARAPMFPNQGLGGFWGFHNPPYGFGMSYSLEPPWTRYGVHVLLRDAATGQAVFESSALHLGPWSDTASLLPAVVRAAVRDYPTPTPQARTVRVEVGPQGMSDRP